MNRRAAGIGVLLFLLFAVANGQEKPGDVLPTLRLGPHAGVQTSVLRYTVVPYTGEFQSTVEQGAVYGVSLAFPLGTAFRLQVDVAWWKHEWAARHDGDPAVEISRGNRSSVEFPMLLQFHLQNLPVPLYFGVGPVVSLLADEGRKFTVRHTGFTEKDGWRTSSRDYEEEILHIAVAGEAGVEAPLSTGLSLQMAVRLTQPMGRTLDEAGFALRELSVWRFRIGLLFSL
ncbi:MAG: hypothetical protein KFF77_06655 [Bacteroidetes bacterium]|nr:hypothetical protein [Bacteroidota bacterium]